jgi:hypothetical protein
MHWLHGVRHCVSGYVYRSFQMKTSVPRSNFHVKRGKNSITAFLGTWNLNAASEPEPIWSLI